jgi:uridylate kinase
MNNEKNPTSLKLRGARETIIISLGGSLVVPNDIDISFLKNFKHTLEKYLGTNPSTSLRTRRFFIIVGGGKIARVYQNALLEFGAKSNDRDWIGINVTRLNAGIIKQMFAQSAYSKIITDPNIKVKTNKDIIVGAGWKPGWSTDYDAVLIAKNHNVKTIINLSNIDYVYDKDPNQYPEAKALKDIDWKTLERIVGDEWTPGMSAPFDPKASKLASKLKLKVVMINGKNLDRLEDFLNNKPFIGTVIQ